MYRIYRVYGILCIKNIYVYVLKIYWYVENKRSKLEVR